MTALAERPRQVGTYTLLCGRQLRHRPRLDATFQVTQADHRSPWLTYTGQAVHRELNLTTRAEATFMSHKDKRQVTN